MQHAWVCKTNQSIILFSFIPPLPPHTPKRLFKSVSQTAIRQQMTKIRQDWLKEGWEFFLREIWNKCKRNGGRKKETLIKGGDERSRPQREVFLICRVSQQEGEMLRDLTVLSGHSCGVFAGRKMKKNGLTFRFSHSFLNLSNRAFKMHQEPCNEIAGLK